MVPTIVAAFRKTTVDDPAPSQVRRPCKLVSISPKSDGSYMLALAQFDCDPSLGLFVCQKLHIVSKTAADVPDVRSAKI